MADRLLCNPVTGFGESWRLTQTSQWGIVGLYLVFSIPAGIYRALTRQAPEDAFV